MQTEYRNDGSVIRKIMAEDQLEQQKMLASADPNVTKIEQRPLDDNESCPCNSTKSFKDCCKLKLTSPDYVIQL
jgi:hypothetical protein